jgi:hypothetical protein
VPGIGRGADSVSQLSQLGCPPLVGSVVSQRLLQGSPGAAKRRRDRSDDPTAANHDEGLAPVLDAVEDIGEPPRCVGCTELPHKIRLSEATAEILREDWLDSGDLTRA